VLIEKTASRCGGGGGGGFVARRGPVGKGESERAGLLDVKEILKDRTRQNGRRESVLNQFGEIRLPKKG